MKNSKEGSRLTWQEFVEFYPDKWVILRDVEEEGSTIISAILVEVCTDEEIDERFFEYIKDGKRYEKRRTSELGEMGVIYGKNFDYKLR